MLFIWPPSGIGWRWSEDLAISGLRCLMAAYKCMVASKVRERKVFFIVAEPLRGAGVQISLVLELNVDKLQ